MTIYFLPSICWPPTSILTDFSWEPYSTTLIAFWNFLQKYSYKNRAYRREKCFVYLGEFVMRHIGYNGVTSTEENGMKITHEVIRLMVDQYNSKVGKSDQVDLYKDAVGYKLINYTERMSGREMYRYVQALQRGYFIGYYAGTGADR